MHHPTTLPAPLSSWQSDLKNASTVPADPDGKQVHGGQTLNTVDVGTSLLVDAQGRPDFSMATAIEAMAATLQTTGLPEQITFDRDARFVGSTQHRDCPSPFLRLWQCLGVQSRSVRHVDRTCTALSSANPLLPYRRRRLNMGCAAMSPA